MQRANTAVQREQKGVEQIELEQEDSALRKLFSETPDADGIFLHCPRWPTIRTIPLLEEELGKPVVSTSQAMIRQCLKMIRVKVKVDGWGKLMETLNEAP